MQITRGVIEGAQRTVIYGVEGIGKSYFASKFPNPVFIDTEGSTKHMDVARTPKPTTWTSLMAQVIEIKQNPTICDTLVIDTADWAEQLAIAEICKKAGKTGIEDFGYGKGYTYLMEEFSKLLALLNNLVERGINVVLVAHASMRKFEQPDEMGAYDRWELKLQKKVAPLVKEWADMLLFANYKTYVIKTDDNSIKAQGGKRVIYTTHHPCWDAKNRHDLLEIIPLDYDEIKHCIPARGQIEVNEPAPEPKPQPDPMQEMTSDELWADLTKEVRKDDLPAPRKRKGKNDGLMGELQKLMALDAVTDDEVRRAVADRGYYEQSMPIANYDKEFIQTVLIGAWDQVLEMVKENREIPY